MPHTGIDDRKYIVGIKKYELKCEYESVYETVMQLTLRTEFIDRLILRRIL